MALKVGDWVILNHPNFVKFKYDKKYEVVWIDAKPPITGTSMKIDIPNGIQIYYREEELIKVDEPEWVYPSIPCNQLKTNFKFKFIKRKFLRS